MKRTFLFFLVSFLAVSPFSAGQCEGSPAGGSYTQITQEEARAMMIRDDGHLIVDVRRQDEYDEGHIPGAVLVPNESIQDAPPEALPDRDQILLVYCRSGRRSKEAAQKLADMGYTRVYEFGGIITWPGETVTTEEETAAPALLVQANGYVFRASLQDNPSARAFAEKLSEGPVEVAMQDYGSFEKVGSLPWSLPRSDEPIETVPGDVILYQGDKITVYYDHNAWTFTRLAHIFDADKEILLNAFGDGGVTVTFRLGK